MALIELQDVCKLYGFGDATTLALDEIRLNIEEGEFVAVMGASGCGKSTLMNLIGLLDHPTQGNYTLSGRSVSKMRASKRAKIRRDTVGFIFQSFNLLPNLTVLENVALPLFYKGVSSSRRLKRASDMLERVGLRNKEYFYPRHLSGGQAQSVAIARALINEPSIIIADEPTGNLDSASSRLVMELLADIHQQGNTILFVTHNPELTRYATRVVYMHDGAIVHDEKTALGQVAKGAQKLIFTTPNKTAEDDFAGVSLLMKTVPNPASDEATSPEKPTTKRRKRSSAKKKAGSTKPRSRTIKVKGRA